MDAPIITSSGKLHTNPPSKVGFHYFPDTYHYTEKYLQTYLPILKSTRAAWLVLISDLKRAIPEYFLSELIRTNIKPIIHLPLPISQLKNSDDLQTLFDTYARWGVQHFQLFDRPNVRASWPPAGWVQQDLVERFLDRFIPPAKSLANRGAIPLFPALEPGGNFWDTAFLKSALESLKRRDESEILGKMGLSALGWTYDHPVSWGAGGPERWPEARPYFTPEGSEDHRGFNIFEWYQSISKVVLQKELPIYIFQAGLPGNPASLDSTVLTKPEVKDSFVEIFKSAQQVGDDEENELPDFVKSVNFWLLDSDEETRAYEQSWFHEGKPFLPHAQAITAEIEDANIDPEMEHTIANDNVFKKLQRPINHYVLFASGAQGSWEKPLAKMVPYINKHHPTIGFSVEEAFLASRVTIIGSSPYLTKDTINRLKKSGCFVERINDDGTIVAQ